MCNNPFVKGMGGQVNNTALDWKTADAVVKQDRNYRITVLAVGIIVGVSAFAGGLVLFIPAMNSSFALALGDCGLWAGGLVLAMCSGAMLSSYPTLGLDSYVGAQRNILIANFKAKPKQLTQFTPLSALLRYGYISRELANKLKDYQALNAEVGKERALYSSVENSQEGFLAPLQAKEKTRDELYQAVINLTTQGHLAVTPFDAENASHSEVGA
ncbi:MAG: hypothetical protein KR126chlam2_00859 [Chlamydiae bacterium]|nr:hypothetical protein [Chlamydiota bacterium]